MEISYRKLYEIIHENKLNKYQELSGYISRTYDVEIVDETPIRHFFRIFKEKWGCSGRIVAKFEYKYKSWLDILMTLKTTKISTILETREHLTSSNRGRPAKSLDNCSEVSKRRKLREHNENLSTDLVKQSLCQRYKYEKQHQKAFIVEAVDKGSPDDLEKIKDRILTPKDEPQKFTPEEALSLFLDLGLSKDKYIVLRNELQKRNHYALPSYNKIIQAKKMLARNGGHQRFCFSFSSKVA